MKRCLRCREIDPACGFGMNRSKPSGLNSYCRLCIRAKSRASYDTRARHMGALGWVLYGRWKEIRKRCTNPHNVRNKWHSGRGIKICRGWDDFERFAADMGPLPSRDYQIDRIDNDGHYSCGKCDECVTNGWTANCRWATRVEQARNRRTTMMVTIDGRAMALAQLCEQYGHPFGRVYQRIRNGWPVLKALSEPAQARRT